MTKSLFLDSPFCVGTASSSCCWSHRKTDRCCSSESLLPFSICYSFLITRECWGFFFSGIFFCLSREGLFLLILLIWNLTMLIFICNLVFLGQIQLSQVIPSFSWDAWPSSLLFCLEFSWCSGILGCSFISFELGTCRFKFLPYH